MNAQYDVEIDSINTAGDGLARIGRTTVAVPFTIPGERVRIRLLRSPRQNPTAAVVQILRPSPHRVEPRCPHFGPAAEPGIGPCGGCAWQHIAYPEQLRLKTDLVDRLVRNAVPEAPPARPMLPSTPQDDPWGYRNKVHFTFDTGGGPRSPVLLMGHYVRGSRSVIPVRDCPVHDPRGNELAFAFKGAVARDASPTLDGLAIRVGAHTPEIMATLVVTDDRDKGLRSATRRLLDRPGAPTAFFINVHHRRDALIFGRDTRRVSGPERMREEVENTSFLISPTAFFQTNVGAAEVLVRLVRAAVPAGARVLDLYAGAGLFALPLAQAGHEVVAVEESRAAVADGEASRRLNSLPGDRCRFVAMPVEHAFTRRAIAASPGDSAYQVVVLDPPREGCSASVLGDVFGGLAPPRAIYVSCNPETLARDLAVIAQHGYAVESLQPVDMFPHTAHVETVVVINRTSPRPRRVSPTRSAAPRAGGRREMPRGAPSAERSPRGPARASGGPRRRNRR